MAPRRGNVWWAVRSLASAFACIVGCARAVTPLDAQPPADAVETVAISDGADVTPPADTGPFRESIYLHACALSRSCGIPFEPLDLPGVSASDCIAWFQVATSVVGVFDAFTQALFNCSVMSDDCASFRQCAIGGRNPACSGTSYCSGTTRVECERLPGSHEYSAVSAFDCANTTPSQLCTESLGVADCSDGSACETSTPPRCDGNVAVRCNAEGRETRYACDWLFPGTSCVDGACAAGSPCGPSTGVACNGNVATVCDARSNRALMVDCASVFQGTCSTTVSDGILGCVASAHDCSVGAWRCNGSRLEACVNGRFHGLDCTSIGTRTCGNDPVLGAVCEP